MLSNLLEDLIVKWLQVYPLVLRRSKKLGEFLMKGLVGLRWLLPLIPVLETRRQGWLRVKIKRFLLLIFEVNWRLKLKCLHMRVHCIQMLRVQVSGRFGAFLRRS
jgi:hypothetical protein